MGTKGWGLFKEGKVREAVEILQKSWDIHRIPIFYNGGARRSSMDPQTPPYHHEIFLHLKEAKRALIEYQV